MGLQHNTVTLHASMCIARLTSREREIYCFRYFGPDMAGTERQAREYYWLVILPVALNLF